jgi:hypothetical protein
MNHLENKLLTKLLIFTGISTAILMTGFEMFKMVIHTNITIWESHIATIVFTTLLAVFLTYLAIKKHDFLVRILSGFIPTCAWCKNIRDEKGNWVSFEVYFNKYSNSHFTHGICPECEDKFNKKKTG